LATLKDYKVITQLSGAKKADQTSFQSIKDSSSINVRDWKISHAKDSSADSKLASIIIRDVAEFLMNLMNIYQKRMRAPHPTVETLQLTGKIPHATKNMKCLRYQKE
jgi:hypothetical protein